VWLPVHSYTIMYIIKLKKRKQDNSHLNRVSGKANAIGCVRLFVRLFPRYLLNQLYLWHCFLNVCLGNWHYVFACMHYSLRCQNGNQDFFSQFLPASAVLAMACVCLLVTSVCVCVYACVCHKSEFHRNGWTYRAFWHGSFLQSRTCC